MPVHCSSQFKFLQRYECSVTLSMRERKWVLVGENNLNIFKCYMLNYLKVFNTFATQKWYCCLRLFSLKYLHRTAGNLHEASVAECLTYSCRDKMAAIQLITFIRDFQGGVSMYYCRTSPNVLVSNSEWLWWSATCALKKGFSL